MATTPTPRVEFFALDLGQLELLCHVRATGDRASGIGIGVTEVCWNRWAVVGPRKAR